MGTHVRVVAGYRAFSAFILLRRGKATGALFSYVFFLVFPFCSFSFVCLVHVCVCASAYACVCVCVFFFRKNSALRKYRVSRQRIAEKSSAHSEMDAWRNAQRRNTSDLPVTAKYLRMSNGRCVYARARKANKKKKEINKKIKDFKNT